MAINWPTSDTLASNATDISTSNGPGIITAVTVKKMEKHKAPKSNGEAVTLAGSDAMAVLQQPQFNTLTWQLRSTHQFQINRLCALAAFADGPDDEGLAAPHVTGSVDLVHASFVAKFVRKDIAAWI